MDWIAVARRIDAQTARTFVTAARHVVDALLIEAEHVRTTQAPTTVDYNAAGLPRDAVPGGWISIDEVRDGSRRMAESIAAEKWVDGFLVAVKLLAALGVAA